MSWRERMDLWNDLYPWKQYEDPRNFSKACKQVRRLVLEPKYTRSTNDDEVARENRRRDIKRRLKKLERELRVIRKVERDRRIVREAIGGGP